jgi:hypothetical protein
MRGTTFHTLVKRYLERDTSAPFSMDEFVKDAPENVQKLMYSGVSALDEISRLQLNEVPVAHPSLLYQGRVDCAAYFGCGEFFQFGFEI